VDASDLLKPIAKVGGLIRLHGVGLVILGALAVWAPQMTGMTVSVIVGVLLIIGGIVRTTFAWIATGWGSLFLRAAVGILTIIAGVYMIMEPNVGLQVLAIVLISVRRRDHVADFCDSAATGHRRRLDDARCYCQSGHRHIDVDAVACIR